MPRITSRVDSSDLQGKESSSWMTVPKAGSITPRVNLPDFFTLGRFSSRKFCVMGLWVRELVGLH